MSWTDLLVPERIAVLSGRTSRDDVLAVAARMMADGDNTPDGLRQALQERESLCGTGIGKGVAIPHARGKGRARAAFLKLDEPVDFGAGDGVPVDLVFAMRVPDDSPQFHLQLLSQLAAHFADDAFRAALRSAADPHALHALLSRHRCAGNPDGSRQAA